MGKVKELQSEAKRRKQINLAAQSYLSNQDKGDLYDAYMKLLEASERGEDYHLAIDYIEVWQPLENMTVAKMIQVIEDSIIEDEIPEFFQGVDWQLLKEQKKVLLEMTENIDDVPKLEALEGVINLINQLQDDAVDKYGYEENLVFDLSDEDEEIEVCSDSE